MGRFLKVRLDEKDTTVNIGLGKSKVCYRYHPQMKSPRGKVEGLQKMGIWGGFQGLTRVTREVRGRVKVSEI